MIDQSSQFMAILTAVGEAKQANADAMNIPWTFSQMGVGDANGTDPQPNRAQTKLINERRRAPLNQVKVDPKNTNVIIAEQVIPENVGGWWIREIGLYDADGDLVAVANCAPSFKPELAQGSGKTQVVRINFIVSSAANVTLKIDPSVVLATRQYVDDRILEVLPPTRKAGTYQQVTVNERGVVTGGTNPDTLAGNGILDAYTKAQIDAALKLKAALASPALTGVPTAPTAVAGANSQQLATTAFVQATVAAVISGAPGALDTLKELADALGGDPNFANTIINGLAQKADKADSLEGYGILNGMKKGEAGWGAVAPTVPDMKALNKTQFAYQVPGGGTVNGLSESVGVLLNAQGPGAGWQIMIRDDWFYFRGQTGGIWSPDRYMWHSGNFNPAMKADKANTLAGYLITDAYTQAQINGLLALKAPLASPTFSGVVNVPTAAPGSNNSQAANTAFVTQAIASLVASSPGMLDTLAELAAALGNDPNFASTVMNAIAGKLTPGDYGVGGVAVDFTGNNLNTQLFKSGLYRTFSGAQSIPPGTNPQGSMVRHDVWADGVVQQTFEEHVTSRTFRRSCTANVWGPWQEVVQGVAGMVAVFAMNAAPTGWLVCNGAPLTIAAYPELYSKIGLQFGGDATTFKLPDLRGETIRGIDLGRGVNPNRAFASLELDAFQDHGHANSIIAIGQSGGSGEFMGHNGGVSAGKVSGRTLEPVALSGGAPRTASETRSRNIALLYCIKY